MTVRIRDLPGAERPRERLLSRGAESLSDRELLALVLRNGRPGKSAIDLAAELLAESGSLSALASLRPEELARRPGIGPAKAAAIVAAFRLGCLASSTSEEAPLLRGPEDIARVAILELARLRRERVIVLISDASNRLRRVVRVSEGSIDRAMVPIREILNTVLVHDGRAFAVAHNHPSGDIKASDADLVATSQLQSAAQVVGLRFLDHAIVTRTNWTVVDARTPPRKRG